MIYYFSGTGNSQEIALCLAKHTGDSARHICKEAANETLCHDKIIGFVFPVYGWTIPEVMVKFIEQLYISNPSAYIYMVCTCGDDAGLTDEHFYDLLKKKNLSCQAAWSIQMPDTYIGLPGFNVDSEKEIYHKLTSACKQAQGIAQQICRQEKNIYHVFNGKFAWVKTHILGKLFYALFTGDQQFRVDEKCTHCGKCKKVCPMNNIEYNTKGLPTWNGRCTDCLACYHHCPHHAIQYGKFSKGKGQYKINRWRKLFDNEKQINTNHKQ